MEITLQPASGWLDPDWFQAVGSVLAILAGFAYVIIQNRFATAQLKARQKLMREHLIEVAAALCSYQTSVQTMMAQSQTAKKEIQIQYSDRPFEAFAVELMSTPVADVGLPGFAMSARKLAGNAMAFFEVANKAVGKVADPTDVRTLLELKTRCAASLHELKLKR